MSRLTDRMGEWTRNLTEGRNGSDELCRLVVVISIVLLIIAQFVATIPLAIIAFVLLGYGYFRAYSKNYSARRKENERYLRLRESIVGNRQSRETKKNVRDQKKKYAATHAFFTCNACGHELMVPKGKGKIRVTCPHCGNRFEARS